MLNKVRDLGQKGFAHIFVVLLLLAGIIAGVYLVQNATNIFPKATVSAPVTPTTGFSLVASKPSYQIGEEIQMDVIFHTDIAPANLFAVKLNYDPSVLKLAGFSQIPSPSYEWIEMHVIDPGKASFVVGVPNPGIQTQASDNLYLVRLRFTALKSGSTTISFDDTSAIYSNADNVNILVVKESGTVVITDTIPSTPPDSTPQPSPTFAPACATLQNMIEVGMWSTCGDEKYNPVADTNKDQYVNGLDVSYLISRTDGMKDQTACLKYLDEKSNPCPTPTPSPTPPPGPSTRVFVTSTTYNGNLGGLSGADAKCQDRANAANLGGTWKAWLSDGNISAKDRLVHSSNPYVLVGGGVIADNWSDLTDGTLKMAGISQTELKGGVTGDTIALTNTNPQGNSLGNKCNNFTSTSGYIDYTGRPGLANELWTQQYNGQASCSWTYRLYCFEQPTPTASATPIPGSGDGNKDGKIDLTDFSILMSDFNKDSGFRTAVDMNGDGKINTIDGTLLRDLLVKNGIIKE